MSQSDSAFLNVETYLAESDGLPNTAERFREIAAKLVTLESLVAKLPKTKDGVSVVPTVDTVWCVIRGNVIELPYWLHGGGVTQAVDEDGAGYIWLGGGRWEYARYDVMDCYSTEEAARGDNN